MKKYIIIFSFIFLSGYLFSQGGQQETLIGENPEQSSGETSKNKTDAYDFNCATFFQKANEYYNNGDYNACIELLNRADKDCKLNKKEKEDVLVLGIRANIEKDNTDEVNSLFIKMLKNNPNYKLVEGAYQDDYANWYKKYTVRPKFTIGSIMIGFNAPQFNILKVNSIFDSVNYSAPYKGKIGKQNAFYFEYEFMNSLSFSLGLQRNTFSYSRELSGVKGFSIKYNETMVTGNTLFYFRKYFPIARFRLYCLAGIDRSGVNSATGNVTLTYTLKDKVAGGTDEYHIDKNNIDVKNQRTTITNNILLGAGVRYKANHFIFETDLLIRKGLDDIMSSKNQFSNKELTYTYYYLDNSVKMNCIFINASVGYILKYSVKKKKNA